MNKKNLCLLAVKRLMREARELHDATDEYYAYPLEENLFEWHFTVQGPPSTDFEGGVYHGKILLPPDYPMKPPNIILLTVKNINIKYIIEKVQFKISFV
jgi:ubiquitin-conjugating enzyme E2 J1